MEGMDSATHGVASPVNVTAYMALGHLQSLVDMDALRREFNCTGGCEERFAAWQHHPKWTCDGRPDFGAGGSWIGHVWPGVLFVIWATHWLQGFIVQYYSGLKRGVPYQARAYYQLWRIPVMTESWIKALLPIVCMALELKFGHEDLKYTALECPEGSGLRAGHMVSGHVNNFNHAFMYPGFIVSGIVDLVSAHLPGVPSGASHLYLFLCFTGEALMFGLHKKHSPADVMVHFLLTVSISLCAFFSLLEACNPRNPLLGACRITSLFFQGAWFFASAHVMFEGRLAWSTKYDTDIVPVMAMPLLFAQLAVCLTLGMAAAMGVGFAVFRPPGLLRVRGTGPPKDADVAVS